MSTYCRFAFERSFKAADASADIGGARSQPSKENRDWARRIMKAKAAFLLNTVTARRYVRGEMDSKSKQYEGGTDVTLRVDSAFPSVTLSWSNNLESFMVGNIRCTDVFECSVGTFIQELARTVVS